MPTHVAPSYTHHPRNGDTYSAYNKPVAIIDWWEGSGGGQGTAILGEQPG